MTRAHTFAKDKKPATVATLKRYVRISDNELAKKIYDYHKRAGLLKPRLTTPSSDNEWFQSQFKKVHRKTDETLSPVRRGRKMFEVPCSMFKVEIRRRGA